MNLPAAHRSAQLVGRQIVRWGIIGCGDVTEVKSGPGFQQARGSELVAVMRRNGALAADYARRHGVPRWYDDAAKLIADPDVDAVYVATPPDTHAEYTLAALAAGKPVYVEKPMARHTPECDRMLEAATRAGQKLFVAYYRRALPRFFRVKTLLESEAIGRVGRVESVLSMSGTAGWRLDAAQSGGGLFLDVGSHVLDLIDLFAGPITALENIVVRRGDGEPAVEDSVSFDFQTKSGIRGSMRCDFRPGVAPADELAFIGENERDRLSVAVFNDAPVRLSRGEEIEKFSEPHPPHVAQPLIQTVVDDLLGNGVCASSGEAARRTSWVMDQVLSEFYAGRDDEFWLRPQTWRSAAQSRGV